MNMKELPYRQIHLDFHTSPLMKGVGSEFDIDDFGQTLKDAGVNSINLFAKGHHGMYYYPTKIGTVHPEMEIDLFGQQVESCRKYGIRVCAYTTVVWNEDWADRHPEWLQVNFEGVIGNKPPFHAGWRHLCMNVPEHVEYLKAEFKEIYDLYKPEGYWIDIIFQSSCVCPHCLAEMKEMGLNPENLDDVKKHDRHVEIKFMKQTYAYIKSFAPDAGVYYNGHPSEFDLVDDVKLSSLQKRMNMDYIDIESLPSEHWGYAHFPIDVNYVNKYDQEITMMNGKFHNSWGDFGSLRNRAQLEYECFRALAAGAKSCVGDQLHPSGRIDKTVYKRIGEVLNQIKAKEEWSYNSKKISQIGVYASNKVLDEDKLSSEGAYRMMTEMHHLYDFVDYYDDISGYDLVILPDRVELDDGAAAKIKAYLNDGGKVILTGKSGINPKTNDFAIEDFGVKYDGAAEFCPRYFDITENNFPDIPPMEYCMYEQGEDVSAIDGTKVLSTVVNPQFNRAWDHFCSHRQTPPYENTGEPAIVATDNTVYIAAALFKDYAVKGCFVFKQIIKAAMDMLLEDKMIVTNLPSTAEVTLRQQPDRQVVHLLHYIPMKKSRNMDIIEEVIPLYGTQLAVKMDKPPQKVYLAPQMNALDFEYCCGYVKVAIDKFEGHQMVVFE